MSRRLVLHSAACALAAGCALSAGAGCKGDDDACSIDQLKCTKGKELTFEITPFQLSPGQERSMCLYFDWPEDAYVQQIINTASTTLHHLEFVQIKDDAAMPPGTEKECPGFLPNNVEIVEAGIYGAGAQREPVNFPSDQYGMFIGEGKHLLSEVHYLNLSDETQTVSAPITIKYTTIEPPKLVSLLVLDNLDINVPVNTVSTCPSDPKTCAMEEDTSAVIPVAGEIFFGGFHYHSRGVLGEGTIIRANGAEETFIVEDSYVEPVWNIYTPPKTIGAGDKIRWRCWYNNNEGRTLVYSNSSSKEEMCTLGLYVSF
jgi:hypothetical protein